MSGTAGVSNLFANAVTATGAQLDANYSTIVAYINDPTNRNNYAVDTGSTNTVVLTYAPAVVGGYTTGLEICFKAGNTNSGATVVNANGLGNVSLVNPDGSALSSAQITIGSIYDAAYDGTRFVGIGFNAGAFASAAQVSAAASINTSVTPGRMQNSPVAAKAWASWNGTNTGTITAAASYNVTQIVRQAAGTYAAVITTPFADTNYSVGGTSGQNFGSFVVVGRGTGTITFQIANANTATVVDSTYVSFIAYGNQ